MTHASPRIDVLIECRTWLGGLSEPAATVRRAAAAAFAASGLTGPPAVEICIVLADDARVRDLNVRYLDRDRPTNVLAFPGSHTPAAQACLPPGAPVPLGDVVLAYETVAAEARAQGKALGDHLSHLVIHGVLHCVGRDHDIESKAIEMERLETSILAGLGIDDPYRAPGAGASRR